MSTADDGSELRTCIDGKQRLTSIQRYIQYINGNDSLIYRNFQNLGLWMDRFVILSSAV